MRQTWIFSLLQTTIYGLTSMSFAWPCTFCNACHLQNPTAINEQERSANEAFLPTSAQDGIDKIDLFIKSIYQAAAVDGYLQESSLKKCVQMIDVTLLLNPDPDQKQHLIVQKIELLAQIEPTDPSFESITDRFLSSLSVDSDSRISDHASHQEQIIHISRMHKSTDNQREQISADVLSYVRSRGPTDLSKEVSLYYVCTVEQFAARERYVPVCHDLSIFFKSSSQREFQLTGDKIIGATRRWKLIGNVLELKCRKVDGELFDLQALRGKVVLIDFWATWCGPCVATFPHLSRLHKTYGPHGFEIVGISLDSNYKALANFLSQRNVPWIMIHHLSPDDPESDDDSPLEGMFGIFSIPTIFLVDRDGKVLSTAIHGNDLDQKLAELFPDVAPPEPVKAETSPAIESPAAED